MKFDVVIGNPPYQDSSHAEKKNTLWRKFLHQSIQIAAAGGVVSLIIPSSWCGSRPIMQQCFLPYNLLYLNKDECKKWFPDVGSSFSYFVLTVEPYGGITEVVNKEPSGKVVISTVDIVDIVTSTGTGILPRVLSPHAISIIHKTLSRPPLGIKNTCEHHNVKRDRFKKHHEGIFVYPSVNTPSATYWFDFPHPTLDIPKIVIPTSTYYKTLFHTTHGTTQGMCYLLLDPNIDPDVAAHNLNNKVFDFINECFRYANWNNVQILRRLPYISLDRSWTDAELYAHFDLTQEEIDLIESTVK